MRGVQPRRVLNTRSTHAGSCLCKLQPGKSSIRRVRKAPPRNAARTLGRTNRTPRGRSCQLLRLHASLRRPLTTSCLHRAVRSASEGVPHAVAPVFEAVQERQHKKQQVTELPPHKLSVQKVKRQDPAHVVPRVGQLCTEHALGDAAIPEAHHCSTTGSVPTLESLRTVQNAEIPTGWLLMLQQRYARRMHPRAAAGPGPQPVRAVSLLAAVGCFKAHTT